MAPPAVQGVADLSTVASGILGCVGQRQIVITSPAREKVSNLQEAGYPYVFPLGKFVTGKHGGDTGHKEAVTLLQVRCSVAFVIPLLLTTLLRLMQG